MAGIAHEINTPIGVGITAASHLEQQTQELLTRYHQNSMRRSDLEHYVKVAEEASRMLLMNLQMAAEQIQIFKQVAVDQTSAEKRRFNVKRYLNDVFAQFASQTQKYRAFSDDYVPGHA